MGRKNSKIEPRRSGVKSERGIAAAKCRTEINLYRFATESASPGLIRLNWQVSLVQFCIDGRLPVRVTVRRICQDFGQVIGPPEICVYSLFRGHVPARFLRRVSITSSETLPQCVPDVPD